MAAWKDRQNLSLDSRKDGRDPRRIPEMGDGFPIDRLVWSINKSYKRE